MRKTILIIAALFGLAALASAQPRALGVRIGNQMDVSYEHSLGSDFLEFEGGLEGYHSNYFHVDGVYNLMLSEPDLTDYGTWGIYAGAGAGIAAWGKEENDTNLYAGVLGNLGIEYNFEIPLQVSLDVRPRLMFGDGSVWHDGIFSFGFSFRYLF